MTLTTDALETLRGKLPWGYQRTVVERLNHKYSQPYVHQVAYGKRQNEEILAELLKLAEEAKQKRSSLEEHIASI